MAYVLETCAGEGSERSFPNPTARMIDQAISDLVPEIYHYAILEVEPAIEKCAYVQTLIERDGKAKGLYLVETRFKFVDSFRHYRTLLNDADEVKRLFRKFAEGVVPSVAGWDDITGKMMTATE